jgi:type IV secretory pathway VirJ component
LNALKYFWKKKTAVQASADVASLIEYYKQKWHRSKVILLGYSFGADVMPFVYNNFNVVMASNIISVNLLSPSTKTDFEIHLTGLFGGSGSGHNVATAINSIKTKPVIIISGEDEDGILVQQLTGKNFRLIRLAGGHHYDSNSDAVVNAVLQQNRGL